MVTVWQFVDEWNLLAYHRVFRFVLGVSKSEERFDDVMTATKLPNLAGCGRIKGLLDTACCNQQSFPSVVGSGMTASADIAELIKG